MVDVEKCSCALLSFSFDGIENVCSAEVNSANLQFYKITEEKSSAERQQNRFLLEFRLELEVFLSADGFIKIDRSRQLNPDLNDKDEML